MLKLFIGNKNYSSWSMRPWVLLKQAGIEFEEVMLRFDSFEPGSAFRRHIDPLSPTGKVPLLQDGDLLVWDTLAIAEYLAERFPEHGLWPRSVAARARARSICAEMHSGFGQLRSHCPMNIEAALPGTGALIWRDKPGVRSDVARLVAMWQELLREHGGPMMFGDFSVADAYYAPICMRLKTYALPVPPVIAAYVARVCALPGVQAWVNEALTEDDFLAFEEPYRLQRSAAPPALAPSATPQQAAAAHGSNPAPAPASSLRPWGWYEVLAEAPGYKVKRIGVAPGQRLSLQKHQHRAEHWMGLLGCARVTVGERNLDLLPGQHIDIALGEVHRLANPGKAELQIIELQFGSYLGEDDIFRLQDDHGRANADLPDLPGLPDQASSTC